MAKLLFLEINEIPFRLIDKYLKTDQYPNISKFFHKSWQYESFAVDKGELHPWVTWPTVHRGMSSEQHNVLHLGQDVNSFKGSPIWDDLRKQGKTVGVFGSMQSWPPRDPGKNGFYIPDTFAHDEQCIPHFVEPLQKMNLGQVRKNGRVVAKELPSAKEMMEFLVSSFRCGISMSTMMKLAAQVIGERFNPTLRSRRPIFQTIIFWDVFKKLYFKKINDIDYASFFTNHVAGVMHRYWSHVFPEDFKTQNSGEQENTMRFALGVLDEMLGDVFEVTKTHSELVVVFGTSMGQGAVYNDDHLGYELTVGSIENLFTSLGFTPTTEFKPHLSMVPLIGVEFTSEALVVKAMEKLSAMTYKSGAKVFEVERAGLSLNIKTLWPSLEDIKEAKVHLNSQVFDFETAGIRVIETEAGTGYHVPEGIFAVYSNGISKQPEKEFRKRINSDRLKAVLMGLMARGPAHLDELVHT